jgi:hypothetical protein
LCRLWRSPKTPLLGGACVQAVALAEAFSVYVHVLSALACFFSFLFRRCCILYCARRRAFANKHLRVVARRERAQRRLKYSTSAAKFKTLTHASVTPAQTHRPAAMVRRVSSPAQTHRPAVVVRRVSSPAQTHRPAVVVRRVPQPAQTHRPAVVVRRVPQPAQTRRPAGVASAQQQRLHPPAGRRCS